MKKHKKDPKICDSIKKEEVLKKYLMAAQEADVAKTTLRQKLRSNNQEDVEEYIYPEVYEKNKNNNFLSKEFILKKVAPLIVAAFTMLGFVYTVHRNTSEDIRGLSSQISTIEERSQRNIKVLDRIETSTNEVSRNVYLLTDNVSNIKNEIRTQNRKVNDLDKRVIILEEKRVLYGQLK